MQRVRAGVRDRDPCDFRPREPHRPPLVTLTRDEAIFARLFLRRYATWCARSGHRERIDPVGLLYRHLGDKLAR